MARRAGGPAFAFGAAPHVNLMPRAAVERRERSALLRRWGWLLAATMLVVGLLGGGAYALQAVAQHRLDAENARTLELTTVVAGLAPVQQKLALQGELATFRAEAMATDLSWADFVARFEGALPENTAFAELDLHPGAVPSGEDPTAASGVEGDFVVIGSSPDEFAPLIRAARALPGVLRADGWTQEYRDGMYLHTLSVVVDQSVYSGAYAGEDGQ
jgi:hypothetical protein